MNKAKIEEIKAFVKCPTCNGSGGHTEAYTPDPNMKKGFDGSHRKWIPCPDCVRVQKSVISDLLEAYEEAEKNQCGHPEHDICGYSQEVVDSLQKDRTDLTAKLQAKDTERVKAVLELSKCVKSATLDRQASNKEIIRLRAERKAEQEKVKGSNKALETALAGYKDIKREYPKTIDLQKKADYSMERITKALKENQV